MERSFWLQRWASGRIGFHNSEVNSLLQRHHEAVLAGRGRVLVPLCGKSLDLWWLRDQGHEVVGVELAETAVRAFFEEAGVEPRVRSEGALTAWSTEGLTLLQGDFFELTGRFDAVWDRAALVALPPPLRVRYAQHLRSRVDGTGLLVTFDYPQAERDGPPFAVLDDEVRSLFPGARPLETQEITEAINQRGWGLSHIEERVYALDLSQ